MGWQRQVLRVNLTTGSVTTEPLDMERAERYLGQRGLATRYLYDEIDPRVDAMAPENKLIIATGPLTGTAASTGGRWSAVTKSPLTGGIACSNSGGQFGGELKMAGWDMVILEGRAPAPVYLSIEDDKAELVPCPELWGTTVWHTEESIKAARRDPLIRVASVGPSAEYGCRYACIVNDLHRAAGRSGVGAVMAAKQLKAIAVRGTRGVQVADPKRFYEVATAIRQKLLADKGRQGFTADGTISMTDVTNAFGTLPTRNNQAVQFEGAERLNAKAQQTPNENGHTNLITNSACFACTIGCGRVSHIDPAHFSVKDRPEYQRASGGLEYETAYALGAACGVADMDAATFAGFIANEYGMDPISLGGSIAAAMELYETGALTDADTGGLALRFGSAEALVQVAEMVGKGEGIGRDIGMGSKLLCEKYGRPELSMSSKGQEFAAYDGRSLQGMGLGYATSNRGACHLRAGVMGHDFETTEPEEKPALVSASQDANAALDSTGLCMFTKYAGMNDEDIIAQLDAALGGGWDAQRYQLTGERIWNLERMFNLEAGLTAADDTLPPRILETPAPSGTAKGLTCRLDVMLPAYYAVRGWNEDGTIPAATRERLGL